ncbi:MAG: hydrogenase maturation nickel metallochaperone HypA [Tissierellia bacterium]|nr:hydrogenase maturation nickel metallochaperone HypA [Tissierellia bacterium]
MHELGIMFNVVRSVENFAKENGITVIDTLVLQIGELSPVIPRFVEACYPAAIDGTMLENTKLEIEVLPGNAICTSCDKVFNLIQCKNECPVCGSREWEVLGGREFLIKEIVAY